MKAVTVVVKQREGVDWGDLGLTLASGSRWMLVPFSETGNGGGRRNVSVGRQQVWLWTL